MRDLDDVIDDMREGHFFSNGTEFEIWQSRWCNRCSNDNEATAEYCPILTALVLDMGIPTEINDSKECSEFCLDPDESN